MISKGKAEKIRKEVMQQGDELATIFRALGDPNRFHVFRLLLKHPELCVSEIASIFNVSVPAISQQLRILEMTGLLKKQRYGQTICYSIIKKPSLKSIIKMFEVKTINFKN